MKCRALAICCALALLSSAARSATYELVPKIGYQLNAPRTVSGPDTTLRLDNEPVVGLSLGYLTQEDGELEFSWTRSNSPAHIDQASGAPARRFDVDMDQLHFNGLYMLKDGNLQPFVLVGLGLTHYSVSGNHSDNTKFSFAAGGGAKWLWNDHIGLRFDGLWTPTLAPDGADFFCDPNGNCANIENDSFLSRRFPFLSSFQFTTGLLLRY
jgi:opacity protein-like surface antigen